jgi:hypothetical protein
MGVSTHSPTILADDTTVGVVAVLQPGLVRRDGDLSVAVYRFNYELDGIRQVFVGALDQLLTDDSWNFVFLDFDGSLNINTTGFPTTTHIRLAKVRADNGYITSIIDERVLLAAGIDKNIHQATAEGQDGTTADTWEQKVRLTLNGIDDGAYIVQWYCELRHSTNNVAERSEMRIEVNDMTEIGYSLWPYNLFEDSGGFAVANLSAGDYTIDLDYRQQGGGTAYIRRARLLFWRIA